MVLIVFFLLPLQFYLFKNSHRAIFASMLCAASLRADLKNSEFKNQTKALLGQQTKICAQCRFVAISTLAFLALHSYWLASFQQ